MCELNHSQNGKGGRGDEMRCKTWMNEERRFPITRPGYLWLLAFLQSVLASVAIASFHLSLTAVGLSWKNFVPTLIALHSVSKDTARINGKSKNELIGAAWGSE